MAIVTEVKFAHERGALADTFESLPEVEASVVRDARTNPDHDVYIIRFGGTDLADIESALAEDRTVEGVEPMPGFEDEQLLGIEFAPETMLLNPEVTNQDGFVIKAQGANVVGQLRGWHERWLLPDGSALRSIWQYADQNGFEFEVIRYSQHGYTNTDFRGENLVTDQQRDALVTAFEGGYFTEPREMSLEELAEELGISATAASGRLRRGMKTLISGTIIVGEGER